MSAITDIISDTISKVQAQPVGNARAELRRTREVEDPHPYDNTQDTSDYTLTQSQLDATGSYLDGQADEAAEAVKTSHIDPNGYTLGDLRGKSLVKDFASGVDEKGSSKTEAKPLGEGNYTPGGFYTNFFLANNPYKAPTEEELEKQKKREKRDMLMAKIGAGLSAFNTAYSTSRGIRPIVNPADNIVGRTRERYERLQKERDAKQAAWTDGYMKAANLDQAASREARNAAAQARQIALKEREEERRKILADVAVRKQDWLEQYQQGRLDIDRERAEIEREYKQGLISKAERDAAANELRAQAAYLNAQKKGTGGGSRGSQDKTVEKTEDIQRDAYGNIVKKTSSTSTSYGNQGGKPSTNLSNIPPSARPSATNNTPPSRRRK